MPKSGVKTSEFYVVLAGIAASVLMATNVIGPDEEQAWQGLIAELLPGAAGIVMYVWSRTRIKAG